MAKLTMTRRSFIKAAAVSAAAAMISTSAMTALAEDKTASTTTSDGDVKRIRTGCRGCGKVECAIWVTVRDGKAIKIEGDDSAWHANGNCCAKSQAGLQAAYHPDRIYYPMKRTAPIGDDDPGWVRISWEEGLQACADKLVEIRDKYGNESLLAFGGTSRQWANPRMITTYLGGANCFEAVEICKGPRRMTAATVCENGMHWIANVDYPLVYVQWGTEQTQSNYDDTCRTVNEAAHRSKCFISVDPRISNCGKIADYFLPLRPGTDLAMVLAWTHVVMEQELYDDYFVKYWSNATYLVCEDIEPSGWVGVKGNTSKNFPVKTRLLKESDMIEGGNPRHFMVWNNATDSLTYFDADEDNPHGGMWETQTEFAIPTTGWEYERGGWVPDYPEPPANLDPALWCENGFPVTLKDGRQVTVKTVWQTYWDTTIKDMTIAKAAEICEVDGKTMEEACKAWVVRYDERRGNGGLNIQLAPEQTGVSSQTFRASFILVFMTGNYDTPGGNRAYTRHSWSSSTNGNGPSPQGKFAATGKQSNMDARKKLCGCETFVTNGWWNQWNDANACIDAALEGKPYWIKAAWMSGGDFMNQCNAMANWEAICKVDFFFVCDIWHVPGSRAAHYLFPCAHFLEIPGFLRGAQGAHGGLGAMTNCIPVPADVLFDGDRENKFKKALGLPYYDTKDGGDGWDRPFTYNLGLNVQKTTLPYKTWDEFQEAFQAHGWWDAKKVYPEEWGTYRRYLMGYLRNGSRAQTAGYLEHIPGFGLPSMKAEMWSTIFESLCDDKKWTGMRETLPYYSEPPMSPVSTPDLFVEYPFNMTTGRRIPVYFHNEHRQLPWCREVWPAPRVEINPADAVKLGVEQGDWVWIESKWGKIREVVDLYHGINPGIINAEHQWWFPEQETSTKGFDLCQVNCINNRYAQDKLNGSSQLRAIPVKVYKATPENSPFGNPIPCDNNGVPIIHDASDPRLKAWKAAIDDIRENPNAWEVYAK